MPDVVHKSPMRAPIAIPLHRCLTNSPGPVYALTASYVPLTIPALVKASSFLHRFTSTASSLDSPKHSPRLHDLSQPRILSHQWLLYSLYVNLHIPACVQSLWLHCHNLSSLIYRYLPTYSLAFSPLKLWWKPSDMRHDFLIKNIG